MPPTSDARPQVNGRFAAGSLAYLLARYAMPFWRELAGIGILTTAATLLMLATPALLAAGLVVVSRQSRPGAGAGNPLDLNSLGARIVDRWLAPIALEPMTLMLVIGVAYLCQNILTAGLNYAVSRVTLHVQAQAVRRIRLDLSRQLLSLSMPFFHRRRSGEIISRFIDDPQVTARGLGPLLRSVIQHSVQLAGYALYLLSTSLWLTLGAFAIVAVHFGVSHLLKNPVLRLTRTLSDEHANFASAVQETLVGIRVAKSLGAEPYEVSKLKSASDRVASGITRLGRISQLEEPLRTVLDGFAVVATFAIAVVQLRAGALTLEGLILYVYVGRLILTPANQLATAYLSAQATRAAFGRIADLLNERPHVEEGHIHKRSFESAIELRNVTFSYGTKLALEHVSLTIRKDEVVAIVGLSGAGKSTLTDLLLRLYDPQAGEILMDGVLVRDLQQGPYHHLFGVVSQESLLFHDTVRNNIRYGRDELSDEDVERAARIANADAFIRALPQGYDTLVGDRGIRLSGGERQRVAIARAVAHNPQILILDEATSALDSESERHVQLAIDEITKRMTAIIVAHRLSTILHADRIVVMDRGRVIDQGAHEELSARCSLYRRLCELQFLPSSAQLAGMRS